ncbi:unnamed protein product [Rotaria magnacalcarata]|uniref:N-acetyltransferase domain-containing protein n=1 Tax=Rotaria magnacalcarata TaxID=392030 RepID=A0A819L7I2_9BILA|nr:unnamed protein product [Rotaria magnacalcarata]
MLEIRPEQASDRNDVFRIHEDGFQRNDEAELVDKLRENSQFNTSLSFVASIDNKIVGHLLFTHIKINYAFTSKSFSSLALAPISILSDYQRQGIGSKLIEYGLNELKVHGFASVIVLGHENFYPRFGFVPAKEYKIRAPIPLKNDNCFMALELKPDAFPLNDEEGVVQYLSEFVMSMGKRATKVVSYNEQNDDDDFLPAVDNTKKSRSVKSNRSSTESTTNTKSLPQKSDEKLSKSEQEKSKRVIASPKKSPKRLTTETSIIIHEKANTHSQSMLFSNDAKISPEHLTNVDDQEEDLSPKSKRMKHEADDDTHDDESENKNEEEELGEDVSMSTNEISISTTKEKIKNTEMSIDHHITLIDDRHFPTRTSDLPKTRASVPLGFPTSKINISSPHAFRVGLSRKSSTIKPLHPNITSRVVHE